VSELNRKATTTNLLDVALAYDALATRMLPVTVRMARDLERPDQGYTRDGQFTLADGC
jgi:hypothetical protein